MSNSALMETYRRLPVAFVRGEGAWLIDRDGRRYLDALCGIAVCGLGHAHPRVTEAITAQATQLIHSSNLYEIPQQEQLAQQLCAATGMDRVFFGNSGAEANEAAIKLARCAGHQRTVPVAVPTIIVMEGAFHGRTLAALTATDSRSAQAGFEPLLAGFVRAPYGDLDALARIGDHHSDIVAVLLEPIQGENGIVLPPPDYLARVRALCDTRGWLMMLDEVQTGAGRTGALFAFQIACNQAGTAAPCPCTGHCSGASPGVLPDIVTTAKGIANGVPLGACLARGAVADLLGPGMHGSTFGGNPLATAAALATLNTIKEEGLATRAAELGIRLRAGLEEAFSGDPRIKTIRGQGLMIGIELTEPIPDLVARALDEGLLINVTAERVVRLLPPLILSDEEADEIVRRLRLTLDTH